MTNNDYQQVCIWPGTLVVEADEMQNMTREERIARFETFMREEFGVRVKYLEEVKTNPDLKGGVPVPNTGGRNDLFFSVHNEDINKFAVPRLRAGIRWYEDVVSYNGHSYLYPQEILDKYEVRW